MDMIGPMEIPSLQFPAIAKQFYLECYPTIKKILDVDFDKDVIAHGVIREHVLLDSKTMKKRKWFIESMRRAEHPPIFIITPGTTLQENIELVKRHVATLDEITILGVDGANNALIDHGIKVDIMVTDLDGLKTRTLNYIHDEQNSTSIIHGHGNNIGKIKEFFDDVKIDYRYIFTTQIKPESGLYNWGGFTDGDRAVFCAIQLGFKQIFLVSMDVDNQVIGSWSKPRFTNTGKDERSLHHHPIKQVKLNIANRILKWLSTRLPPRTSLKTLNKHPPFSFLENVPSLLD
ncbi:DUF115 domain-containing protein [Candidatus Bathyarchaeota archaeon]|nr:DUF115 domain-containing protein [Candidatus Bathyarchaeota archaeon]